MTTIVLVQPRASLRGTRTGPRLPFSQRGVVLFIALIVLVAMTMAGIAIMRSVDTGNLISGNFAFKQATLQAGDNGANAAIAYLLANEYNGQLSTTNPSQGYSAFAYNAPTEPDWTSDAAWANAVTAGTDANGNKVEYVINRLCDKPGPVNGGGINCALLQQTGAAAGCTSGNDWFDCKKPPMVLFRITSRATGPRDATSIIQYEVALQQ